MTPRIAEPTDDQAEDVVVVDLGGGWSMLVTEGLALLLAPRAGRSVEIRVAVA